MKAHHPHHGHDRLIRLGAEAHRDLWRNNVALLISLMVLIFALPSIPVFDQFLTRVVLILIVISGLFAAEFTRRVFRILFVLGTMVVAITIIDMFQSESPVLNAVSFLANLLFFIVVTVALVTQVAKAEKVDASMIICAINSYLLIGLTAALLCAILDLLAPASFPQIDTGVGSFSSYVYFSFVTLTTLGYGDITPATPLARSLSTFTALFGQLYLVIIMAMIIGKFLNKKG